MVCLGRCFCLLSHSASRPRVVIASRAAWAHSKKTRHLSKFTSTFFVDIS